MIVAGTWNDEGGKPSGYMEKLAQALNEQFFAPSFEFHNGGNFDELEGIIDDYDNDIIFWFPDVPNSKEKLVGTIKKLHPKTILVTSKNNVEGKYDFMQLTAHALRNKANLFVEFTKSAEGLVEASVYDPIGNSYVYRETNVEKVAAALHRRITFLWKMTRVGSTQIGDRIEASANDIYVHEFTDLVHKYADVFHDLIHGSNPSRLMGNCSFRCTKGGFPSFRRNVGGGELIFVSRRNIDKRDIGYQGFVAVKPVSLHDVIKGKIKVEYYGEHKPSVDTPIQLALYALYPHINYMLHSHVYVDGAPFTARPVPCGAIEEVEEILEVQPHSTVKQWQVNLKGHGSLVAADVVGKMRGIPYVARTFPETQ
jgi:hypothetical protein